MDVFFGVEHRLQIDGVLIIYIPLYSDRGAVGADGLVNLLYNGCHSLLR
jgi:hypothetical protein